MSKVKLYNILKIKINSIINSNYQLKMNPEDEREFIIKQQDTQLFNQIKLERGYETKRISELIYVEAKHNKKRENQLKKILAEGFTYNEKRFVRFGKSSSQAKDGITVFIDKDYYDEMMERSQLGVTVEKCTISKYESYRCLVLSSCQFVDEKLPYIVLVDEYKKILSDQYVRYAVEKDIEYFDKNTKQQKVYKNQKLIEEGYQKIDLSPFDGFGVHSEEVSKMFSKYLNTKHVPVAYQIRLPFLKGMSVQAPFKEFYADRGITRIKDIFGKWHEVSEIDCIWNTSMFKAFGLFKDNFGENAWKEYLHKLDKYQYRVGISKYSHHIDNINLYTRMNFQYLQCLNLLNPKYVESFKNKEAKYDILDENNKGKVISLAEYSTSLFEKIIKGDKLYTLKFLGLNDSDKNSVNSKYIEAILTNAQMLKDPSIKSMLKRKLNKSINQMKYGKIYAEGFYHTVIGDIIGYLEYCGGLEVAGSLGAGDFFAKTISHGDCLSFRSPLVDPSEVNKVKIVENDLTDKYLAHFKDQDVCMINMYDLTMQQQGGMDEDGDSVFLCTNGLAVESKIKCTVVVDIDDKKSANVVDYTMDNIVNYECNSRDNRIGEITNIATSILNQYTEDEHWKKINRDNVSLLRLYQGKEIDFIKTGYRWIISKNLRKYLRQLPYFLLFNYPQKLNVYNKIRKINKENGPEDKIPYNAFRRPSPMNELCEYINQWEKRKLVWDRSVINNRDILIDHTVPTDNKRILREVKSIYDEFKLELKECLDSKDGNLDTLYEKYKDRINGIKLDSKILANYCISVAYKSMSEDKSLCWSMFGDEMLENLRMNSEKEKKYQIVKTEKEDAGGNEFLGKYYKLIEI